MPVMAFLIFLFVVGLMFALSSKFEKIGNGIQNIIKWLKGEI